MDVITLVDVETLRQGATLPAAVVALAFLLDLLVSEFPQRVHPVALFGRVIGTFDRPWRRPRSVGLVLALLLPPVAGAIVGGLTVIAYRIEPFVGVAVASLALFSTVSLRMLLETAREVVALTESGVTEARTTVRALVGRETESLSPAELRSAAVESAAENLADGLVGPLLAFAVGAQFSVAVGVAAAVVLKAVNTMDSMLGYRSKPVGAASARLDDLLMWLPARASAFLLALAAFDAGALWRARSDARAPASPNSGWPMATVAATGNVQLSKPGAYTLNTAATHPSVEEANACLRTVAIAGFLSFVLSGALASAGVVAWS